MCSANRVAICRHETQNVSSYGLRLLYNQLREKQTPFVAEFLSWVIAVTMVELMRTLFEDSSAE